MKKLTMLLIVLLTLLSTSGYAIDIVKNGDNIEYGDIFRFKVSGTELTLEYVNPLQYNMALPATVECEGQTYKLVRIGSFSYMSCISEVIDIPEGVTAIDDDAFKHSGGWLHTLIIPKTMTQIAENAFDGASNIKTLKVFWTTPLKMQNNHPFAGRESEITLYVPYGTSSLYEQDDVWKNFKIVEFTSNDESPVIAFKDGLTRQICVENWDKNGDGRFSQAEAKAVEDIGKSFSRSGTISSFEEFKYFTNIKAIPDEAFYWCESLTSIALPESVTSIGDLAFACCYELTSIAIPNTVTTIGTKAFMSSRITSITVPDGVVELPRGTFDGCTKLENITLPNSLVTIGGYAFRKCESLSSLTLPNQLESIGNDCFYGCKSLKSIVIPASVTSIGRGLFGECENLMEIEVNSGNTVYDSRNSCNAIIHTYFKELVAACNGSDIPNGVKTISLAAFNRCTNLTSITIPESVEKINEEAFIGCSNLQVMKVDENNRYYDSRDNCNAIIDKSTNTLVAGCKNTIIPSSVTSIGEFAFYENRNLTKISIPKGVTSIQSSAFDLCSGLQEIVIPEGVSSIGNQAFYGCSAMTLVDIPGTVEMIEDKAFDSCYKLEAVNVHWAIPPTFGNNAISQMKKGNITLTIPLGTTKLYQSSEEWAGFKSYVEKSIDDTQPITFEDPNVKSVCLNAWDTDGDGKLSEREAAVVKSLNGAFKGNSDITTFKELRYFTGLKAIYDQDFYNCTSLTEVVIPNVQEVEINAFESCKSLNRVEFLGASTVIDDGAFHLCGHLSEIIIPESNTAYEMKDGSLIRKSSMTLIRATTQGTVPLGTKIIGTYAFSGCLELTDVEIPASVVRIGILAFENCKNLRRVSFNEGLNSIDIAAFRGCTSLSSVEFPISLTKIGREAFEGCNGLTSIFIPKNVKEIGERPFKNCTALDHIEVDAENSVYDSRSNCNAIIEKSSDKMVGICKTTFIPEGIRSVGLAFYESSVITSLEIPSSVTEIPNNAFRGCSLTTVTVNWQEPIALPGDSYAVTFRGSTLFVPEGTVEKYRSADGWKCFGSIKDGEGVAVGDTFSDMTEENVEMWFRITSLAPKTCEAVKYNKNGSLTSCINMWTSGKITVPETAKGYKVTGIGNAAFTLCQLLTEIKLPETIEYIGTGAFAHCTNLTALVFPASLNKLGRQLFRSTSISSLKVAGDNPYYEDLGCNGIFEKGTKKLVMGCGETVIPQGIVTIGDEAFFQLNNLKKITIPNTVQEIGESAFAGCSMNSLIIPNSVTTIGSYAFANCKELTELILSEKLTKIPNQMVSYSSNLKSLKIPSSVKTIEDGAFEECCLTSLEIPEGVEEIGEIQFYNSPNLTYVTFPASMKSLGVNPFEDCPSLEMVKVADGSRYYKSIGNKAIMEQETGKVVAYINEGTTLRIPDGVKRIGSSFLNTSSNQITSMILPESIEEIEFYFFEFFSNLSTLRVLSKKPAEVSWSFNDDSSLTEEEKMYKAARVWYSSIEDMISKNGTTLFVPTGCTDAYKQNPFWEVFFRYGDDQVKEIEPVKGDFSGTGTVDADDVVTFVDDFIDKGADNLDPDKYDLTEDGKVDKNDLMAMIYLACGYTYNKEAGRWIWTNPISGSRMTLVELTEMLQAKFAGSGAENMLTGISKVVSSGDANVKIYNLKGQPSEQLRKGLNIVRDANGRVRKVFVK